LQSEIKKEKPWLTFGISPFGIWRPGFPEQIKGFDAYDQLYADARHWTVKGWVDYLAPQLYWPIDAPEQSYSALFKWWRRQNRKVPIWPGSAVTRINGKSWPASEIVRQVQLTRDSSSPGHILWNLSTLAANPNRIEEALLKQVYSEPAVPPLNPRHPRASPPKPVLSETRQSGEKRMIRWEVPRQKTPAEIVGWVAQFRHGDRWETEVLPRGTHSKTFSHSPSMPDEIAISAIDRYRAISLPSTLDMR
jgi:hypothetical protein